MEQILQWGQMSPGESYLGMCTFVMWMLQQEQRFFAVINMGTYTYSWIWNTATLFFFSPSNMWLSFQCINLPEGPVGSSRAEKCGHILIL
jgi:hypothetical protein